MTPLPLLALAAASTLCEAAGNASADFCRLHRADEMHCLRDKGMLALRCSSSWFWWLLQDPRVHVDTSEPVSASAECLASMADPPFTQLIADTMSDDSAQPERHAWQAAA